MSPGADGLGRLFDRPETRWALAYLAAAWAAVQVVALVGQQFHWPEAVQRGTTALAFLGALPVGAFAWAHHGAGAARTIAVRTTACLAAAGVALAGGAFAYVRAAEDATLARSARLTQALTEVGQGSAALERSKKGGGDERRARLCLQAERRFESAAALDPELVPAWSGLVDARTCVAVYSVEDRAAYVADARTALAEVARLAPETYEHNRDAALVAQRLDLDQVARAQHARRAFALRPDLLEAFEALYKALLDNEALSEAEALLGGRLTERDTDANLWTRFGDLAFMRRDWPAARERYQRAIALESPAPFERHMRVMWVMVASAADLDAVDAYLETLRPAYATNFMWLYYGWNNDLARDQTQRALARIRAWDTSDLPEEVRADLFATTCFFAGDAACVRANAPIAISGYERAVASLGQGPHRAEVYWELGQALALFGDKRRALAALDTALVAIPPGPRTQVHARLGYQIAIAYSLAGEPARAVEVMTEAMKHPYPGHSPNTIWYGHDAYLLRRYPPFETLMRTHGANIPTR